MESERIGKRIAAMAAELADLVAEPFDALSTAERCALAALAPPRADRSGVGAAAAVHGGRAGPRELSPPERYLLPEEDDPTAD